MDRGAAAIHVTLDQARALDALDRAGTLVAAAAALHKGHTAVMYGLRQLEAQTGLTLLDRRGYRLRLTAAGRRVLELCRRMLEAEAGLVAACHQMRTGWEPSVRVVHDGVCDDAPLLTLRYRRAARVESTLAVLVAALVRATALVCAVVFCVKQTVELPILRTQIVTVVLAG